MYDTSEKRQHHGRKNLSEELEYREETENIAAGALGALLFALIGGALWVFIFWADIFPSICGLACIVAAVIGYRLFGKKASLKGVFIAFAAAVFVMLIACYFSLAIDVYNTLNRLYADGEYSHQVSFLNAVAYSYQFLSQAEVVKLLLKDFGWGMLFCVIGAFTFVVDGIRQHKRQKEY